MKVQTRSLVKGFSVLLMLLSTAALFAQYKGSVRVAVTADSEALPGAVVSISSSTFNRSFVTDANGTVLFVGLTPERYELKVTMSGFNTVVRPDVIVDTGNNVRLEIAMEPASQSEEMVVTAETPITDVTQTGSKTVLTTSEIEMIPQARDPWAVLDSIPGLQTDRINVGGNESGQQAQWVGQGDDGSNSAWMIDGVEFTDFAAEGSSQSYLDFGSFSQIGFDTGGTGVESGASGTVLNFVTKQGTNQFSGSMRLLWADEAFVSTNVDRNDPVNVNSDGSLRQNTIFETFEKGFELGGPIIKDRFWFWGAFSQNTVKNITRSGQRDDTDLENISFKLHGDITDTTRVTAFYTEGDKLKFGRSAGPSRAPETTWNQDGPTPIYKFEVSQLIGQSTELQFIYSDVGGGFNLLPQGGFNTTQATFNEELGRWENTYFSSINERPQINYNIKGNTFLTTGNMDHELTYGFEYKEFESLNRRSWGPDTGNLFLDDYTHTIGTPEEAISWVYFYRDRALANELESTSLYVQDTITMGNLTLKAGLRWNDSEAKNVGAAVDANPFVPEFLPSLNYNGDASAPFSWESIAPSLGATYTFGDDNQFLVRANYRLYYDAISTGDVSSINPVGWSRIAAEWRDLNGDGAFQVGEEFYFNGDPYTFTSALNVNDPGGATDEDLIDPNLDPPKTNEFIVGGEWAITPEFSVELNYTYRIKDDYLQSVRMLDDLSRPLQTSDYEVIGTITPDDGVTNPITGDPISITQWALKPEIWNQQRAGIDLLRNNPGYETEYQGIDLILTKRMSNRWMMRGHFSLTDWTQNVDENGFISPNITTGRGNVDGEDVLVASAGSGDKGDVFLGSASYTAYINGAYQLPWDVVVSGSATAREGYAFPLFYTLRNVDNVGLARSTSLSTGGPDDYRADDVFFVNAKVTKSFKLGGTKVDFGIEVFNLFNDDNILQVTRQINSATFNRIDERLAPRVGRFSATVTF